VHGAARALGYRRGEPIKTTMLDAVKLAEQVHLVDSTWVAPGSVNGNKFEKLFDDYYFWSPRKSSSSPLPENADSQFLESRSTSASSPGPKVDKALLSMGVKGRATLRKQLLDSRARGGVQGFRSTGASRRAAESTCWKSRLKVRRIPFRIEAAAFFRAGTHQLHQDAPLEKEAAYFEGTVLTQTGRLVLSGKARGRARNATPHPRICVI